MKKQFFVLSVLITGVIILYVSTAAVKYHHYTDSVVDSLAYAGPQSCAGCHADEFNQWKDSHHFHAMEMANDSTVLGNFDNIKFSADGMNYKFFTSKGKYMVNVQGPDGKNHNYKIAYTFGYYPLQQYLIWLDGGKLQVLRASWNVNEKKWFHQYSGQIIDHSDWLSWAGGGQRWNTMCSDCHSTGVEKNYDAKADTFHTTWQVLNVSCESCHGPAKKHVEWVSSVEYKNNPTAVKDNYILSLKDSSSGEQLNSCAPCHSRRMKIEEGFDATKNFHNYFIPQIPVTPDYTADGRINEEDYEYGSFTQSKMYAAHVQCSNCHNPHSGQLKLIGNALCLQCHSKNYDSPDHHHHTMNTAESSCISCHMATNTYMGIDVRHDHGFKIPRPDLSVKYGITNTCNQCHKDKEASWADSYFKQWYDSLPANEFADDLVKASLLDSNSAGAVRKILSDETKPSAIKASVIYYASSTEDQTLVKDLLLMLNDKSAQVRYQTLKALSIYNSEIWLSAAVPLLHDSVKSVRLAAAELFTGASQSIFNDSDWKNFLQAKNEYEDFLTYQFDFPTGHLMMGNYLTNSNKFSEAIDQFISAVKMDSLLLPARIKLATVYDQLGQYDKAMNQLQQMLKIDSANTDAWYYMALLFVELNKNPDADKCFKKAVFYKSTNARVYYNYALFSEQQVRLTDAEQYYKEALKMNPLSEEFNYAMATFYFRQGEMNSANKYATILAKLFPLNKNYQQLLQLTSQ